MKRGDTFLKRTEKGKTRLKEGVRRRKEMRCWIEGYVEEAGVGWRLIVM